MKKFLTVFIFVYLLLAVPAYADSAAVYQDFAAKMPQDVQYLLSQSDEWQTVRFAENDNGYVVLLEGTSMEPEEVPYLLLQISRENWQETSGTFWMVSAYQKSFNMPQMVVTDNAVWLQFWNGDGDFLLCCVQPDGDKTEKRFPNGAVSLGETGAVMFDEENGELIFWNGQQEKRYPVPAKDGDVDSVAELQGAIYYLNHAGELYRVSDSGETWILNLQDIYQEQSSMESEPFQKVEYLDYKELFYCNNALWLLANDPNLSVEKFLVKYDGEKWIGYENITAGRYSLSWAQGNGSTNIVLKDYYPLVPHPMMGQQYERIYTIGEDEAESTLHQNEEASYISRTGEVWQYGMKDVLLQRKHLDGNCERFGLAENQSIRLYYDDTAYLFDVMPYIKASRVLVPVRGIAELLGAEVIWDNGTVTIVNDNGTVRLNTKESLIEENGVWQRLDTTIENVDGRIMVPIRFVAEALQIDVRWNSITHSVTLQLQNKIEQSYTMM